MISTPRQESLVSSILYENFNKKTLSIIITVQFLICLVAIIIFMNKTK